MLQTDGECLLYADDLVLSSESKVYLRRLVEESESCIKRRGLEGVRENKVNQQNSK